MPWFHGTRSTFEAFEDRFIGTGNDERGPGFYFTSKEQTARHYAGEGGCVIEADPGIDHPMSDSAVLSRGQIGAIIAAAPDHRETLENFGEIDMEGYETVLQRAVSTYAATADGKTDPLECICLLANDFWSGREAAMLAAVQRETGFNGVVRPIGEEIHAVAWSASQIRIVDIRPVATLSPTP